MNANVISYNIMNMYSLEKYLPYSLINVCRWLIISIVFFFFFRNVFEQKYFVYKYLLAYWCGLIPKLNISKLHLSLYKQSTIILIISCIIGIKYELSIEWSILNFNQFTFKIFSKWKYRYLCLNVINIK